MKLRNKILAVVAPVATIAAVTPIALTSCNKKTGNSVSYNGDKNITTTKDSYDLQFTLAQALGSGETIELSYPKIKGSAVPAISKQEGTIITVTVFDGSSASSLPSTTTFDLTFTCVASKSKKWESTITGFTFIKKAA